MPAPAIALISVPFDLDRYMYGMGLAPGALYAAGLEARLAEAGIPLARKLSMADALGAGDTIMRLSRLQARVAEAVDDALEDALLPVVLGGDCCNALGVWGGLTGARPGAAFGIAWLDAHGDWNTEETTLSGYLGGMPYAAICGLGNTVLRTAAGITHPALPRHCALLGARDLDPPEAQLLATTATTVLDCEQVRTDRTPGGAALTEVDGFYLHFDVDVLDPSIMPGVQYPAPGGLQGPEALNACRALKAASPLAALTIAALDPSRDPSGQSARAAIDILLGILAG